MPYKMKCANCGKEFENDRPRKFCSFNCFIINKQKQAIQRKLQVLKRMNEILEADKHA